MKHIWARTTVRMGVTLVLLLSCILCTYSDKPGKTSKTVPLFEYVGDPIVRAVTGQSEVIYSEKEGVYYMLSGLESTTGKISVLNVATGKVANVFPLPGASQATSMVAGTDGNMYIGVYGNTSDAGKLYRYKPGSGSLEDLGVPVKGERVIYDLVNGPDGLIYGGTYPGAILFSFDTRKGTFANLGKSAQGEQYLRKLAYDPAERVLYMGTGTSCRLIKYNIDSGKKSENVLDDSYSFEAYPNYLEVVGDNLLLWLNKTGRFLVFDKKTMKLQFETKGSGYSLSPEGDAMYFYNSAYTDTDGKTKPSIVKYDFAANRVTKAVEFSKYGYWNSASHLVKLKESEDSAYTYLAILSNTKLLKYNISTNKYELTDTDIPPQPVSLRNIEEGSDGRIYTTGIHGGAGIYNPETAKLFRSTTMSQGEGMAGLGGRIYFGLYPSARISEYDPATPFGASGNPKEILQYPVNLLQDRPFAMVGVESYGKLFIGTVPSYGQTEGALTVFDPKTKQTEYYRNIVTDQSVVSLAYKDGKLFGGTSILGGYGAPVKQKEGMLFVWDIEKKEKVHEFVPVPGAKGVTGLMVGPDDNVWGYADGNLFIMNPLTYEIVYSGKLLPVTYGGPTWTDAVFKIGKEGDVYGSAKGYFFKIDTHSKKVTLLNNNMQLGGMAIDRYGNMYLRKGLTGYTHELWKYNPQAAVRNDVLLQSMELGGGRLKRAFKPVDLSYEAVVLKGTVLPLLIHAVPMDPASKVEIIQPADLNGIESAKTATITVTSGDGKYAATYTIYIETAFESS